MKAMRTKRRSAAPVWTCRDGRQIAVAEMAASHIENALAMLERKGFISPAAAARQLCNPPTGDGARDAWESEMDTLRVSRFVDVFRHELATRLQAA